MVPNSNNNSPTNDVSQLAYKEHQMWESKIDLDEYVDNEHCIPHSDKIITDRAWNLHSRYGVCSKQLEIAGMYKRHGNEYLKKGDLQQSLKCYSKSILARTDYKDAYNNRSLVFMKLGEYDKCIADCSMVIAMIEEVDMHMMQSLAMFKAYFRRAKAHKF